MTLFWFLISFVILPRIIELFIAKRNERWLISHGAVEYGREHYKYIVMLHIAFILSLVTEYLLRGRYTDLNLINYLFLVIFIILQFFRVWVISSLGRYWCTRIYRIPGEPLVSKGLYKFVKHPNYIIVAGEILILPLIFNLYCTAVIFSVLNVIMLSVRIKVENKALAS